MKLGIIGYGNLGKALVKGLICSGISQDSIVVNARSQSTLDSAIKEFEYINITNNKKELVTHSEVIVIVVEPSHGLEVVKEIGQYDIHGKTIVSFMAGITIKDIIDMLGEVGEDVKVVRVMPNLAIANCNGVLGIAHNDTNINEIKEIIRIFEKLGYIINIDEKSLEIVTVTAASGVAFAASLMNAYQIASCELLNNDIISKEVTLRVFESVIDMIKNEESSFENIISRIATKGGTTEAGINALNQEIITDILRNCMLQSYKKANNIIGE